MVFWDWNCRWSTVFHRFNSFLFLFCSSFTVEKVYKNESEKNKSISGIEQSWMPWRRNQIQFTFCSSSVFWAFNIHSVSSKCMCALVFLPLFNLTFEKEKKINIAQHSQFEFPVRALFECIQNDIFRENLLIFNLFIRFSSFSCCPFAFSFPFENVKTFKPSI